MATDSGSDSAAASVQDLDEPEGLGLRRLLRDLLRDYRYMDVSIKRYVLLAVAPSFLLGFMLPIVVLVYVGTFLTTFIALLAGLFFPVVVVFYPKVLQDRRRKQIREHFHLFITHLTILSTTNIDRVEVFRTLAQEDEYDAIAEEMARIVGLVDTWNQSLEDACRMRSERVSSPLMSDFLERLAYTVGAGRDISEFLIEEQDSIIGNFVVRYESRLDRLELLKDVYMSIVLSMTFGAVFAMVIPFIVGINPTKPVAAVIILFAFVQGVFVFAIHSVSPSDPVWFGGSSVSLDRNVHLRAMLLLSVALCLVLGGACYALLTNTFGLGHPIPTVFYLAIPFTPLLLPGYVAYTAEQRIKERDESFPAFIRALGAVESVKQSSTSSVLESLRTKDFGALTEQIDNLYKRLALRVDSQEAWRYFAAEAGSYLIQKFSDMYVTGRRMGGDPKQLGQLIESNISEVLKLRDKRAQATGTMTGTLYGITAANTFALFVGLQVAQIFQTVSQQMNLSQSRLGGLLSAQVYNIPQLQFLLFVAVLVNALLSSLILRYTDRGHLSTILHHFVIQTWISVIVAFATIRITESIITFS
ncbi:flagella-related protein flaJ [Halarchaeum acidiphilum MH1-52-1]|uniref:Flagella-related protein flaJ n=1 Tax=Halarchaeum acidiphilum MH1-52-1 TaxID=1261545 RepID=U3A9A3_9EURY|nr:archaellar assembly protein FlaJ [Halarchaeum acidiphilum]GAD51313.1 flagella-related protein flaJ [Halarchaeum acidiphilum MH1-52-1]